MAFLALISVGVNNPDRVLLDPGYAMLSQSVHVTNHTVIQYFRYTKDRSRLTLNPDPKNKLVKHTTFLVAASCMLVTWLLAYIRDDAEELKRLETNSDTLGLPVRLDGGWPANVRAHQGN